MNVGGVVTRNQNLRFVASALLALSLATAACSNQSLIESPKGSGTADAARFEPIRDVPIPSGSTLDNDRSLILSNDEEWTGRLVLNANPAMPQLFAYYQKQMQTFGWQPITSIMGETGVLTYIKGNRAATVQIKPATFRGSVVTVTMAPRHALDPSGLQTASPDQSVQSDRLPPPVTR